MRNSIQILSAIYKKVNTAVGASITGKVYIGPEPINNQLENITLNILGNPNGYVQDGTANVNIHLLYGPEGQRNTKRFKELAELILPVVEGDLSDSEITLHTEIQNEGNVHRDADNKGKEFYNIRINFQTL